MKFKRMACALGMITTQIALSQPVGYEVKPYLVDVDGVKMQVASRGLTERKPGEPVVIFEAGASSPLMSLEPVLQSMPIDIPWVAYTRSGIEGSEWDKAKPTPEHVSAKLVKMLQTMKVSEPYVMVGYSWGGTLARYFVGLNPKLVSGVVYLDPGPLVTQTRAEQLAMFKSIGSDAKGIDELWNVPPEMMAGAPDFVKREFDTFVSLMKLDLPDRKVPEAPNIPAYAIIAGQYLPHPWKVSFDNKKYFEADLREKIRVVGDWVLVSPKGRIEVDRTIHHGFVGIHPQRVIKAIQHVLGRA